MTVTVFDLAENKGVREYAQDLGDSLNLEPQYRDLRVSTQSISDQSVGVVEYLFDMPVKGAIQTIHHIEYIFVGSQSRYHLDFSSPDARFDVNRGVLKAMAENFSYLKELP